MTGDLQESGILRFPAEFVDVAGKDESTVLHLVYFTTTYHLSRRTLQALRKVKL